MHSLVLSINKQNKKITLLSAQPWFVSFTNHLPLLKSLHHGEEMHSLVLPINKQNKKITLLSHGSCPHEPFRRHSLVLPINKQNKKITLLSAASRISAMVRVLTNHLPERHSLVLSINKQNKKITLLSAASRIEIEATPDFRAGTPKISQAKNMG